MPNGAQDSAAILSTNTSISLLFAKVRWFRAGLLRARVCAVSRFTSASPATQPNHEQQIQKSSCLSTSYFR